MQYLKREQAQFEATKKQFEEAYEACLEEAYATYKERGASRDLGSPFHHRQSPKMMLGTVKTKTHRVEANLSKEGWATDPRALARIIEESKDLANYALFISALCSMLKEETK